SKSLASAIRSDTLGSTVTPFASVLSESATSANGSTSFATTRSAPARAAAIAASPEPVPKSSTRRPATTSGWSSTWRARARPPPPAHAPCRGPGSVDPPSEPVPQRNRPRREPQRDLGHVRKARRARLALDQARDGDEPGRKFLSQRLG